MTASSPRALTVISIMTPTIMKSIVCGGQHKEHSDRAIARETAYKRRGTTLIQGASGTDEETSADGAADGNHLHVSVLELAVQRALAADVLDVAVDAILIRVGRVEVDAGDDLLLLVRVFHIGVICGGRIDAREVWDEGGERGGKGRGDTGWFM